MLLIHIILVYQEYRLNLAQQLSKLKNLIEIYRNLNYYDPFSSFYLTINRKPGVEIVKSPQQIVPHSAA